MVPGSIHASCLVLGLGNTVMSDDGVGPRVVERLRQSGSLPSGVELLDGGTLGLDLLPYLQGVARLIVVDAVETGSTPGSLVRLAGDDVPVALETKLSPHQMGLKDLLAVARLMECLPETIVLIGIQPACLEMGLELSDPVSARMADLEAMVLQEVTALV